MYVHLLQVRWVSTSSTYGINGVKAIGLANGTHSVTSSDQCRLDCPPGQHGQMEKYTYTGFANMLALTKPRVAVVQVGINDVSHLWQGTLELRKPWLLPPRLHVTTLTTSTEFCHRSGSLAALGRTALSPTPRSMLQCS